MSPSISFSFENLANNGEPKSVIYLTDDPSVNKLTLTLFNKGEKDISLKGGAPVAENQQTADSPASLYLNFGTSIPAASVEAMSISASGWAARLFSGQSGEVWALSPTADLIIVSGGSLTFALNKLVTERRQGGGTLSVDYYGIGPSSPAVYLLKYFLQPPPVPGLKDLKLELSYVSRNDGNIAVTHEGAEEVTNQLAFTLRNPDLSSPVVGPDAPKQDGTPTFYLSFVAGVSPGYGSLATTGEISVFNVSQVEANNPWSISVPDPTGELLWELLPASPEVLGTGAAAIVKFEITQVVSKLQPGPTVLYLQYLNIPGYKSGYLSLPINKYELPAIKKFSAEPAQVIFSNKDQEIEVILVWQVDNAYTNLRIDPANHPLGGRKILDSGTSGAPSGTQKVMVSSGKLDWVLTVEDPISRRIISRKIHIKGAFSAAELELSSDIAGLDFTHDNSVVVKLCWSTSALAEGPFLDGEAVDSNSSGFVYKVSKAELAAPPEIPDLPGKVFTLSAVSLTGNRVEKSIFLARTDFPVEFTIAEKIKTWVKTNDLKFDAPYDAVIKNWEAIILPALSDFQASLAAFMGSTIYTLKALQKRNEYPTEEMIKLINLECSAYEKIPNLLTLLGDYSKALKDFKDELFKLIILAPIIGELINLVKTQTMFCSISEANIIYVREKLEGFTQIWDKIVNPSTSAEEKTSCVATILKGLDSVAISQLEALTIEGVNLANYREVIDSAQDTGLD